MEKRDFEKWKSSVLASNEQNKKGTEIILAFSPYLPTAKDSWSYLFVFLAPCKWTRQTSLNFLNKPSDNQELEAMWDGIAVFYGQIWFWWKFSSLGKKKEWRKMASTDIGME